MRLKRSGDWFTGYGRVGKWLVANQLALATVCLRRDAISFSRRLHLPNSVESPVYPFPAGWIRGGFWHLAHKLTWTPDLQHQRWSNPLTTQHSGFLELCIGKDYLQDGDGNSLDFSDLSGGDNSISPLQEIKWWDLESKWYSLVKWKSFWFENELKRGKWTGAQYPLRAGMTLLLEMCRVICITAQLDVLNGAKQSTKKGLIQRTLPNCPFN